MSASTGATGTPVAFDAHMWMVPLMIMNDPQIYKKTQRSVREEGARGAGGRGHGDQYGLPFSAKIASLLSRLCLLRAACLASVTRESRMTE